LNQVVDENKICRTSVRLFLVTWCLSSKHARDSGKNG